MTADRIRSRVAVTEAGCWQWTGKLTDKGYGRINVGGRIYRAHRYAYEVFVGAIPDGLTIDHLCRNRACVNPKHLEPVTQAVNMSRSPITIPTLNAAKTHCPADHPYDDVNTYVDPLGRRRCRACREESLRRYHARRAAGIAA